MKRTHDCAPTLNDRQVLEFCKNGFLMLEAVVPNEINRRTIDYLEAHPEAEPTGILQEPWFRDQVILNPAPQARCALCWDGISACRSS